MAELRPVEVKYEDGRTVQGYLLIDVPGLVVHTTVESIRFSEPVESQPPRTQKTKLGEYSRGTKFLVVDAEKGAIYKNGDELEWADRSGCSIARLYLRDKYGCYWWAWPHEIEVLPVEEDGRWEQACFHDYLIDTKFRHKESKNILTWGKYSGVSGNYLYLINQDTGDYVYRMPSYLEVFNPR